MPVLTGWFILLTDLVYSWGILMAQATYIGQLSPECETTYLPCCSWGYTDLLENRSRYSEGGRGQVATLHVSCVALTFLFLFHIPFLYIISFLAVTPFLLRTTFSFSNQSPFQIVFRPVYTIHNILGCYLQFLHSLCHSELHSICGFHGTQSSICLLKRPFSQLLSISIPWLYYDLGFVLVVFKLEKRISGR